MGGGKKNSSEYLRNSNLELYRIIVMLLIVAHHYVVNSGLIDKIVESPLSSNSMFFLIYGAWGKTGINCFVLITGYFMCKTNISFRKFLKLFLWIITYSITITTIFTLSGYHPVGLKGMWYSVVPLKSVTDGFGDCFILFYLLIPFLNILIRYMTKKQHQLLIVLLLFIYTLHGSVPSFKVYMNYVSWFTTLYILSAYLRLYPLKNDNNEHFWRLASIVSWSMSIISILLFQYVQYHYCQSIYIFERTYRFISDSNAILALTNALTSFMWFKSMKIKNSRLINTIAASSFAVLLIHANSDTMRHWLWKDIVDCTGHYDTPYYWLYAIGCVLTIYAVCTIIDIIRIKTIETPLLNATESLCLNVYNKINRN